MLALVATFCRFGISLFSSVSFGNACKDDKTIMRSKSCMRIPAYGRPLNLLTFADNSTNATALYHCTLVVHSTTELTYILHWNAWYAHKINVLCCTHKIMMAGNKYFQLIGIVKIFWYFDNLNLEVCILLNLLHWKCPDMHKK